MAGYQNNMRYGRPGNMYQQRNMSRSCERRMPERRDNECCNERRMPERRGNECCNERRMPERRETREEREGCECRHRKDKLEGMPLAMAYVPWQKWCEIYDVCEGFRRGTIFRELDMPFKGKGGCNR